MKIMYPACIRTLDFLHNRTKRNSAARDRGGVTVEWGALAMLVFAVVTATAALAPQIGQAIADGIESVIQDVFGTGEDSGTGPPPTA